MDDNFDELDDDDDFAQFLGWVLGPSVEQGTNGLRSPGEDAESGLALVPSASSTDDLAAGTTVQRADDEHSKPPTRYRWLAAAAACLLLAGVAYLLQAPQQLVETSTTPSSTPANPIDQGPSSSAPEDRFPDVATRPSEASSTSITTSAPATTNTTTTTSTSAPATTNTTTTSTTTSAPTTPSCRVTAELSDDGQFIVARIVAIGDFGDIEPEWDVYAEPIDPEPGLWGENEGSTVYNWFAGWITETQNFVAFQARYDTVICDEARVFNVG